MLQNYWCSSGNSCMCQHCELDQHPAIMEEFCTLTCEWSSRVSSEFLPLVTEWGECRYAHIVCGHVVGTRAISRCLNWVRAVSGISPTAGFRGWERWSHRKWEGDISLSESNQNSTWFVACTEAETLTKSEVVSNRITGGTSSEHMQFAVKCSTLT